MTAILHLSVLAAVSMALLVSGAHRWGVVPLALAVSAPHFAVVALWLLRDRHHGRLTEGRAARVMADALHGPANRVVELGALWAGASWSWSLPSSGVLDGASTPVMVLAYMVALDVVGSALHRIMHEWAPAWAVHEIHHQPVDMSPALVGRKHVLTLALAAAVSASVGALLGGDPAQLWPLAIITPVWSYLNHADIRLPVGPLAYVLVTPQYHAIHHSADPQHHDRNYAARFVFIDLLMGTARFDFDAVREYGTGERPTWEATRPTVAAAARAWWGGLWHPVRRWARSQEAP